MSDNVIHVDLKSRRFPNARKHWRMEEDEYLVLWLEAAGIWNMANDLGRPETAIKLRVRKLKFTGAWRALEKGIECRRKWLGVYMSALGVDR